jgi:hypothetical protein
MKIRDRFTEAHPPNRLKVSENETIGVLVMEKSKVASPPIYTRPYHNQLVLMRPIKTEMTGEVYGEEQEILWVDIVILDGAPIANMYSVFFYDGAIKSMLMESPNRTYRGYLNFDEFQLV